MKTIINLLALLLSLPAIAEVDINIDSIKNTKKIIIELTVSNSDMHSHTQYYGVTVEKKENSKWKVVRWDIDCPCKAKCKKAKTDLGINECKRHTWNVKDEACNVAEKGIYRFKVFGTWDSNTDRNSILGVSNEFKLD